MHPTWRALFGFALTLRARSTAAPCTGAVVACGAEDRRDGEPDDYVLDERGADSVAKTLRFLAPEAVAGSSASLNDAEHPRLSGLLVEPARLNHLDLMDTQGAGSVR